MPRPIPPTGSWFSLALIVRRAVEGLVVVADQRVSRAVFDAVQGLVVRGRSGDGGSRGREVVWLPKSATEKQISVTLQYKDKNGTSHEVLPLFREPGQTGDLLKRFLECAPTRRLPSRSSPRRWAADLPRPHRPACGRRAGSGGYDTAGHWTAFTYAFKPSETDYLVPGIGVEGRPEGTGLPSSSRFNSALTMVPSAVVTVTGPEDGVSSFSS